jgi:hypothetical protein
MGGITAPCDVRLYWRMLMGGITSQTWRLHSRDPTPHLHNDLTALLRQAATFVSVVLQERFDGKESGFREGFFFFVFCNSILFAICTGTFSKLCKRRIQWHVEECSVALLCN